MTNRLGAALSPYLRQHAENPVDWWEWGPEAFAEARRRDVPVFLSIGYAACHWCHVMSDESFDDPATAALLNSGFVSVKVDREERPDVDAIYMTATSALTGHGGWPMSVWLDHAGQPFYAGTYFPPVPRQGTPSFRQVLTSITEAWGMRRDEVLASADRIAEALRARAGRAIVDAEADGGIASSAAVVGLREDVEDAEPDLGHLEEVLADAVVALAATFDPVHGGFGGAPKFPPSMVLDFLLRHHRRTGDDEALLMAVATCEAMARGGMYDQLGGGFARYSVDDRWLVPHFEKMLYDNALLLGVYTDLYRATGSSLAARVVRETADFLLRELRTAEGGFASSLDADSVLVDDSVLGDRGEHREGAFYVWTPAELAAVLGAEDGQWAARTLLVTPQGTFEGGASTLQLRLDPDDPERWSRVRTALMAARSVRPRPDRDDKVVAAWNGLAIGALARAGVLFDEHRWVDAAVDAARLIQEQQWVGGRLLRVSRDGTAGRAPGVLEDYADLAGGLLELLAATGDHRWATFARALVEVIGTEFVDGADRFFDALPDPDGLLPRVFDPGDNAYPSGGAAAVGAMLAMSALGIGGAGPAGDVRSRAIRTIAGQESVMRNHPRFAGRWLAVAEALVDGPWQVAVAGAPADPARGLLVRAAALAGRPGMVLAQGDGTGTEHVPLLADRPLIDGAAAAYVCRGFVCELPATTPEEVAARLASST